MRWVGALIPREGLGDLPRDPLRRRMVGHAQRDQASPLMPQDDQDEQQPKVDRRHHKEVHGADTGRMIAQERLPRLARPRADAWPCTWRPSTARPRSRASAARHECAARPTAGSPRSSAGSGCEPQSGPWAGRRASATSSANRDRKPDRCHRTIVSGWTMTAAFSSDGKRR